MKRYSKFFAIVLVAAMILSGVSQVVSAVEQESGIRLKEEVKTSKSV